MDITHPNSLKKIKMDETNITDLPIEVIINILNYVNVSDRNAFRATCRFFYEAATSLEFCDKEKLLFYKDVVKADESIIEVLQKASRPFLHLDFQVVEMCGGLHNFWEQCGPMVRSVTFVKCDMQEKALEEALPYCTSLRELRIIDCHDLLMLGRLLESKRQYAAIQNKLQQLTTIDLSNNRYLTDCLFDRLAGLSNNIECLILKHCHISFHTGLYNKFYPREQAHLPSECVLTFQHIMRFIEQRASSLKKLDFSHTLIDGSSLSIISNVRGLNLESVIIESCDQLTYHELLNMVKIQQNLVELNFSCCTRITDPGLIAVCNNLPRLRKLSIRACRGITDAGVAELNKLEILEELDMCDMSCEVTWKGLSEGVVSHYSVHLKKLLMRVAGLLESQVVTLTENKPNLRILNLSGCMQAVTDYSLQTILENLRWLRSLNIDMCCDVTDYGFSGVLDMEKNDVEYQFECQNTENEFLDASEVLLNKPPQLRNNIGLLRGLRQLSLKGCHLTDFILKYYLKFNGLKELNLCHCKKITDEGIRYMIKRCPALEEVDLSDCEITNSAIEYLLNLPRLKSVYIDRCPNIDEISARYILIHCTKLKHWSLTGCQYPSIVEYMPFSQVGMYHSDIPPPPPMPSLI